MTPPRCWEGALCRIVRSQAGNEGKRVVVQRPAEYGDVFGVPVAMLRDDSVLWVVQPVQPIIEVEFRCVHETMRELVFPDSWLEPIDDPGVALDALTETEDYTHG